MQVLLGKINSALERMIWNLRCSSTLKKSLEGSNKIA